MNSEQERTRKEIIDHVEQLRAQINEYKEFGGISESKKILKSSIDDLVFTIGYRYKKNKISLKEFKPFFVTAKTLSNEINLLKIEGQ